MAESLSLTDLTQAVLTSNSPLTKIRQLLNTELTSIKLNSFTNKNEIQSFLRAIDETTGNYGDFISSHIIFFLMQHASLSTNLPVNVSTALSLLQNAVVVLRSAVPTQALPVGDVLGDLVVLSHLNTFIVSTQHLLTAPAPFASLPPVVWSFKCVEEIVHSQYMLYWAQPPPLPWMEETLNWTHRHALEAWVMINYLDHFAFDKSALNIPKKSTVAKNIINNYPHLFSPLSTGTRTFLTVPSAKNAADAILQEHLGQWTQSDVTPTIKLTDNDFVELTPNKLLLFDFLIEGLLHGVYANSPALITFITAATAELTALEETIYATCKNKTSLSLSNIAIVRNKLLSAGLNEYTCLNLASILTSAAIPAAIASTPFLGPLIRTILQLTMFSKYFYACLAQCSPTSISYRHVLNVIKTAALTHQDTVMQLRGNADLEFSWDTNTLLQIFIPRPPVDDVKRIANNISNKMAYTVFSMFMQQRWDMKLPSMRVQQNATAPKLSPQDVARYCKALTVGTTDSNPDMATHPAFAKEFIRHVMYPTLQKILSKDVPRSRSLHHLWWLIAFDADYAIDLMDVRRALTLAYLQCSQIMSQQNTQPFFSLVKAFEDVFEIIKAVVPTLHIPRDFLHELYAITTQAAALQLRRALDKFVSDSELLMRGLNNVATASFQLCHTSYKYDAATQVLVCRIKDTSDRLTISKADMITTLQALSTAYQDILFQLTQTHGALHEAYIDMTSMRNAWLKIKASWLQLNPQTPNIEQLYSMFLECFRLYTEIKAAAAETCSAHLMDHFSSLTLPSLIPTSTVTAVLEFTETADPETFRENISQPVDLTHEFGDTSSTEITTQGIELIADLSPSFPHLDSLPAHETGHSFIKRTYSSKVDAHALPSDVSNFKDLQYATTNASQNLMILTWPMIAANLQSECDGCHSGAQTL